MEQTVKKYRYTEVEKTCIHCNAVFKGIFARQDFCSKQCRHKHYNSKALVSERSFTCRHCNTPFTSSHARKYCTPVCRNKAHNRRVNVGPHTKNCQVCNKPFLAKGKDKKNCSIECYKQAEKARYIRVRHHINISKVEKIDRFRVFEAYNWHCALCGIPTPKELRGTFKPNEPTLDHIIPLSKGGSHTYNNVQLLCRNCNCAVKNNKTGTAGVERSLATYILETTASPDFSARNV